MAEDNKIRKFKVESEHGLWEPVILTVQKDVIIESSVKKGYEIGASWKSMRDYWEGFDGENKYKITELNENE